MDPEDPPKPALTLAQRVDRGFEELRVGEFVGPFAFDVGVVSSSPQQYRAHSGCPAANSIPPLGSTTHNSTSPTRTPCPRERTIDHSTLPLPAPVAPMMSRWFASSR